MTEDLDPAIAEFMSDDEPDDFEAPEFKLDWNCAIVVDNLPKIPLAKYDKLLGIIKRIYTQIAAVSRLEMPHADGKTIGVAFVEFKTVEHAQKALKLTDGYALDKAHSFKVSSYGDLAGLESLPVTWEAPSKPEFTPRLNPHSWLGDGRDQFAVRYNNETEIRWVERSGSPSLEYGGEREKEGGLYWCEMYVQWSPQGSLLATFHSKGIALWGDEWFSKQGRFFHAGVKRLDFSPRENYMITTAPKDGDKRGVVVWDVRSRRELRTFEAAHMPWGADGELKLAPFQWSFDDQFCARRAKDKHNVHKIDIYSLPSMTLLDKKSLKAEGVVDFQWSPTANIIAYWAPELSNNVPARVTLVEIPSRRELRQKNLVNVSDCSIFWHPDGHYVCVRVTRHTKSKKTTFTSLELFRVNEPLVPVEMLEMKSNVIALAWEPNGGHRFCVVQEKTNARHDVAFYSMLSDGKREAKHLFTLESRPCNTLLWSPMGGYIVLAGLGDGMDGALEFYDVDNKWGKQAEHYRASHVSWDPSGRIVATCVVQPLEGAFFKFQMDNGYKLWTFQGQLFFDMSYEAMYQLVWRPRPKSLLHNDQKKHIIKNLRKYERKFAHDDKMKDLDRQRELTTEKRAQRRAYRALLAKRKLAYFESAHIRTHMRNGVDADADEYYVVTTKTHEILLSTKEVIDN